MKNFWYLFAAYTIIWTFLVGYLVHLSRKNRDLREELDDLRAEVEKLLPRKDVV